MRKNSRSIDFGFYTAIDISMRFKMLLIGFLLLLLVWEGWVLYTYPYSRKTRIEGAVVLATSQVPILSPQTGVVLEQRHAVGDKLSDGDALFTISPLDATRSSLASSQTALRAQGQSIVSSLRESEELMANGKAAYQRESVGLQNMLRLRQQEQSVEADKSRMLKERLVEIEASKGAFSPGEVGRFKQDVLVSDGQVIRAAAAVREVELQLLNLEKTFKREQAESQLRINDFKNQSERQKLEQIDRSQSVKVEVSAPQSGVLVASHVEPGYTVQQGQILGVIHQDEHAKMVPLIRLRAKSAQIRFMNEGTPVTLEIHAYPVKDYGFFGGIVTSISHPTTHDGEAIIDVALNAESITKISNNLIRLLPGMGVQADVIIQKLTLFQWLFEPIIIAKQFSDIVH
jgi:membrane fusion protein